jgi:hypothetical protein
MTMNNKIEVDAAAAAYSRWVRHMSAQAYEAAYKEAGPQELDLRYAVSSQATAMRVAEVLHLMTTDRLPEQEAVQEADRRCAASSDPERLLDHARQVGREEERYMSRQAFLGMYAETLAEVWSAHKGDYSGQSYTADDLVEIYERPADDSERKELLEWIPGSEAELREVLSRRWNR